MLSKSDIKAYLTICRNRRRVRRYIQNANQTLATIDENQKKNDEAIAELNKQTLDLFQNQTIKLQDYRDFLSMLQESRAAKRDNEEDRAKTQTFIDGLNEMLERFDAQIQEVKKYCRTRGKVIPFERQRS